MKIPLKCCESLENGDSGFDLFVKSNSLKKIYFDFYIQLKMSVENE